MRLAALGIQIVQELSPLIIVGLGLLGKKIHDLIAAKTKNEVLRGLLDRLDDAATAAVAEVEQTVVSKWDPTKSTAENAIMAKEAAIDLVESHLGALGLAQLQHALRLSTEGVDTVIATRVEAKVQALHSNKAQGGSR